MVSRALREVSRSGELTGGGITAAVVICTAERDTSLVIALGAGWMTLALMAGAARERSRERLGAGATTEGASNGATSVRSRATLGAGAITEEFKSGVVSGRSRETLGAGGIISVTVSPLRV